VDAFAREVPKFEGEIRKAAENIIHQVVDDVVTDSAEQFVEEQQKNIMKLNSELALDLGAHLLNRRSESVEIKQFSLPI
jgi:hypothetical protein